MLVFHDTLKKDKTERARIILHTASQANFSLDSATLSLRASMHTRSALKIHYRKQCVVENFIFFLTYLFI